MKIIFLFIMLQVFVLNAFAQKNDPANSRKPEPFNSTGANQKYQEYVIQLKPGNMEGYGFEILKDGNLTGRRFQNLVPFFPKGIQKKEDAYKIAQWIINQYKKTGHWENMVPPHVVRQLGIESN